MEKVCPCCGQHSDREWLKNRTPTNEERAQTTPKKHISCNLKVSSLRVWASFTFTYLLVPGGDGARIATNYRSVVDDVVNGVIDVGDSLTPISCRVDRADTARAPPLTPIYTTDVAYLTSIRHHRRSATQLQEGGAGGRGERASHRTTPATYKQLHFCTNSYQLRV